MTVLVGICDTSEEKQNKDEKTQKDIKMFLGPPKVEMATAPGGASLSLSRGEDRKGYLPRYTLAAPQSSAPWAAWLPGGGFLYIPEPGVSGNL